MNMISLQISAGQRIIRPSLLVDVMDSGLLRRARVLASINAPILKTVN